MLASVVLTLLLGDSKKQLGEREEVNSMHLSLKRAHLVYFQRRMHPICGCFNI